MNLCNDNHEEICFEGCDCPLCAMREEMGAKISDLEDEIDGLKDELQEEQE